MAPLFHDYFRRVWTAQQIILASECYLQYGNVKISWDSFVNRFYSEHWVRRQIFIVPNKDELHDEYLSYRFREILRDALKYPPSETDIHASNPHHERMDFHVLFSSIVQGVQASTAGEDKDRIFAMQSILAQIGLALPHPNYNKSLEEIYTDATVAIQQNGKTLNILAYASLSSNSALPSWVIDWKTVDIQIDICDDSFQWLLLSQNASRSGYKDTVRWSADGAVLKLRGVQLGQLQDGVLEPSSILGMAEWDYLRAMAGRDNHVARFNEVHQWLQHVKLLTVAALFASIDAPEDAARSSEIDRWYEIVTNTTAQKRDDAQNKEHVSPCAESTSTCTTNFDLQDSDSSLSALEMYGSENELIWKVDLSLWHFLRSLWLCRLESGLSCLALHPVQPGDVALISEGVSVPFIARRAGDQYKLFSMAWIEDAMQGDMWPDDESKLETFEII